MISKETKAKLQELGVSGKSFYYTLEKGDSLNLKLTRRLEVDEIKHTASTETIILIIKWGKDDGKNR